MVGQDGLSALSESVLRRAGESLGGGAVIVGLSGGADSAVCGWVATQLAAPVRSIFIDHGWKHSAGMRLAAEEVAAALGVPFEVIEVQPGIGASPEGQARTVRYQALAEAALPRELILTGHTADDVAETVLAHLLRGAGVRGLAGIPQARGQLLRPLLGVRRGETRALATELALPWVDDPLNSDLSLRRNRIRNRLLPYLEDEYNPALVEVLARTARVLSQDEAALERLAEEVSLRRDHSGAVMVSAAWLSVLEPAVRVRVIRRGLRAARGPHAGTFAELESALEVLDGRVPRRMIGEGLQVEREGPWLSFYRQQVPSAWSHMLGVPGEISVAGWRITTAEGGGPLPIGRWVVGLDADRVGSEVVVRSGSSADRVAIHNGSKPLREVLAEAGVPPRRRSGWPVLEAKAGLAWVVGARVAEWARPTGKRWVRAAAVPEPVGPDPANVS